MLAVAAGFLLRKPSSASLPPPVPAGHFASVPPPQSAYATANSTAASTSAATPATMMAVLKEELFALETEKLEGKISETEYVELKSAFETVLRRTLARKAH